jgi:hypothetical protein
MRSGGDLRPARAGGLLLCSLANFPQKLPEARRSGFVVVTTLAEYAR